VRQDTLCLGPGWPVGGPTRWGDQKLTPTHVIGGSKADAEVAAGVDGSATKPRHTGRNVVGLLPLCPGQWRNLAACDDQLPVYDRKPSVLAALLAHAGSSKGMQRHQRSAAAPLPPVLRRPPSSCGDPNGLSSLLLSRASLSAGLKASLKPPSGTPSGVGHQPRSRHSPRCGRSTPSVESLPWPG
jgi:hypothetical protein